MAGGIGARFWPMSRASRPKQFIDILGTGQTLIQQTYARFARICPPENIYVVTNEQYRQLVLEQIPGIDNHQVLGEPIARNTAPCIAYACFKIAQRNKHANIIVAPSDHLILKEDNFHQVILKGLEATHHHEILLTLGIRPSRPDTGYGYIQYDEATPGAFSSHIAKVKTFTEKPQLEIAQSFLESGDFLWNSGIFIWNLKSIMHAFRKYLPEVYDVFHEGIHAYNTNSEAEFIARAYAVIKGISIDYGILEKAKNVFVMAADFGWSDLGTWGSLYTNLPKDAHANTIGGKHTLLYDTTDSIIKVPDQKLVVVQGLQGFIVVEEQDALLICKREDEQKLRQIVEDIRNKKGEQYL